LPLLKSNAVFELLKLTGLVHNKSEARLNHGRISVFKHLSLAPSFSRVKPVIARIEPVSTVILHTEAVETASRRFQPASPG
jgi:hypothetical protein